MSTPEEAMMLALQANEAPPAEQPLWFDRSQPDGGAAAELARLEAVPEGITFGLSPFQIAAVAIPTFSFGAGAISALTGGPAPVQTRIPAGETWPWEPRPGPFPGPFPDDPVQENIPRNRAPVPYEPPTSIPPIVGTGILGGVIGGIIGTIWEGWPNELGSGELPNPPPIIRGPEPMEQGPVPQPEDIRFGPIPDTVLGPPTMDPPAVGLPPPGPEGPRDDGLEPIDVGPIMLPGGIPGVGQRDARGRERTRQGRVLPFPSWPMPAPVPAAAPAPVSGGLPDWAWYALGFGIPGIAAASRRRGGSSPVTAIEAGLLDAAGAIAPGMTSAGFSPGLQTSAGGSFSSFDADDQCNCRKKGGKKRKCLARAQLSWRSGPKKGKAAGTRCIRFAD